MSRAARARLRAAIALAALTLLLGACAYSYTPGYGGGYDTFAIGGDYGPAAGPLFGWGPDYHVGPFADRRPYRFDAGHFAHAFHGAARARAIPTLPGGFHGRGGGFHGRPGGGRPRIGGGGHR